MSFADLAIKYKLVVETLNANRAQEAVIIATEATLLARRRIQIDKKNAEGSKFGDYSQAVVPQTYFYKRALSQGAIDRMKNQYPYFISYKDAREANNLPTDAIDFTYSGEMLRNTGVTSVQQQEATVTVNVGGQTDEAAKKLGYQNNRFGNILTLNQQEKDLVTQANIERVLRTIDEILG